MNLADAELPQTVQLEITEPAYINTELLKFPDKMNFFMDVPQNEKHASHANRGQAILTPGTHTLTIRDHYNRKAKGPIHLQLHVSPETDPTEPLQSNDNAREINLGANDLTLFPTGDVDFLKITLKDRGYLHFNVENPPKGLNLNCDVSDEFGNPLGTNAVHIPYSGTFYVRCYDKYSSFGATDAIKLTCTYYPEDDPTEPNNTPAEASPLPIEAWRQIITAPHGDQDYFEINVPEQGYLTVATQDVPEHMNISTALHDANGQQMQIEYPYLVTSGKYYLRVFERYSGFNFQPYAIKTHLTPVERITPLGAEKPTTVTAGEEYRTRLPRGSEQDKFQINLKKTSIVHVRGVFPDKTNYLLHYGEKDKYDIHSTDIWVRPSVMNPVFTIYSKYNNTTTEPLTILTEVEEEFDTNEPNDFMDQATPMELGKPLVAYNYPAYDADYYKIEIKEPGTYYNHMVWGAEIPADRADQFTVKLLDKDGKQVHGIYYEGQFYGYSSRPMEIKEPGTYYLYIQARYGSHTPAMVAFNQKPLASADPVAKKTKGITLDVFVAGVELNDQAKANMERMVTAGGGSFVNAESADQIGEKLTEITDKIEERSVVAETPVVEEKSSNTLLYIILVLAVLAAAFFIWKKTSKRNAKATEED